jgi:hypothetical protein
VPTVPRRLPSLVAIAALLGLAPGQSPASAQIDEAARLEAVVEKLRELRAAEEALLSDLTPEQRAEVERRLARLEARGDDAPTSRVDTSPATDLTRPILPAPVAPRCNTLLLFDTNGDGLFSGADRHWRHFLLWTDRDGNGAVDDKEAEQLFAAGVRNLELGLGKWHDRRGDVGDLRIDERIRIVFVPRRGDPTEGLLAVDADRLREAGGPSLVDATTGEPLPGTVVLRPGLGLRVESGEIYPFDCP